MAMAEASPQPGRYFCHCCSVEIVPRLPVRPGPGRRAGALSLGLRRAGPYGETEAWAALARVSAEGLEAGPAPGEAVGRMIPDARRGGRSVPDGETEARRGRVTCARRVALEAGGGGIGPRGCRRGPFPERVAGAAGRPAEPSCPLRRGRGRTTVYLAGPDGPGRTCDRACALVLPWSRGSG